MLDLVFRSHGVFVMHEIREDYKKLARLLMRENKRVDRMALLKMAHDVRETRYRESCFLIYKIQQFNFTVILCLSVPTGGELFRMFVTMSCSDGANRNLARAEERVREGGDPMTIAEFEKVFATETHHFLGHAINACARVNRLCQGQLYYHTLNAKFHGLSRSGIEIQSKIGLMMSLSTFDDTRVRAKKVIDQNLRWVTPHSCT